MARIGVATVGGANAFAFLDTLAVSEHTVVGLANSDDGYNVIVGGTPQRPTLVTRYRGYPRVLVTIRDKNGQPALQPNRKPSQSTATGRCQETKWIFESYRPLLNLRDFSPISRGLIALRLIKECGAMSGIVAGHLASAVTKCSSRWTSLPGAGYGQHENTLDSLLAAYRRAGGVITS